MSMGMRIISVEVCICVLGERELVRDSTEGWGKVTQRDGEEICTHNRKMWSLTPHPHLYPPVT